MKEHKLNGYVLEDTNEVKVALKRKGIDRILYDGNNTGKIFIIDGKGYNKSMGGTFREAVIQNGYFFRKPNVSSFENVLYNIFAHQDKTNEAMKDMKDMKENYTPELIDTSKFKSEKNQKILNIFDGFIFGAVLMKGSWKPCKWDSNGYNCIGLSNRFNLKLVEKEWYNDSSKYRELTEEECIHKKVKL